MVLKPSMLGKRGGFGSPRNKALGVQGGFGSLKGGFGSLKGGFGSPRWLLVEPPILKNMQPSNWVEISSSPSFFLGENQKYLSCHHLVYKAIIEGCWWPLRPYFLQGWQEGGDGPL